MPTLDNDTVKIAAGIATALFTALIALYSALRIKRFDLRTQERKERAAQRLTYYVPLLRFCYELDSRIGRIFSNLHNDWLRLSYLEMIRNNDGFAKDPRKTGYFIISSVYVFACFFGWTEAIQKGIDATRPLAERGRLRKLLSRLRQWIARARNTFMSVVESKDSKNIRLDSGGSLIQTNRTRSFLLTVRTRIDRAILTSRTKNKVFFFDSDILVVRKLFQYEELFRSYAALRNMTNPRDACRLHRHLQHSIGEMMLQRDGNIFRCKTFREFYESYRSDDNFRYWFAPLEDIFADLSDFSADKDIEEQTEAKNDLRPLRLLAIRYWCRILMRNLSKELGIETPPPEEVLRGCSDALKTTVKSVTIEQLESHLASISNQ